jgi:hypothetical protein
MTSEIKFNGPPTPPRANPLLKELREACRVRPGEWGQVECGNKQTAANRAQLFRRKGFEAVSRGTVLYARFVPGKGES